MEVKNANLINEQVVEIFYEMKHPFVQSSDRTNVVLAAFTTVQARLKLYKVLRDLGPRVCYYDMDSVMFTSAEGEWTPPLEDFLGEFADEMEDGAWITFVSAGPKKYAYKAHRDKKCCKLRGITFSFRSSVEVNLESMIDMVESRQGEVISVMTLTILCVTFRRERL